MVAAGIAGIPACPGAGGGDRPAARTAEEVFPAGSEGPACRLQRFGEDHEGARKLSRIAAG